MRAQARRGIEDQDRHAIHKRRQSAGGDGRNVISRLAIAGYRSLRDVRIELGPLNLVTGANGSGKSSLYRSLRLLADVAQGRIIQSLAHEGGLQSTLWAGRNPSRATVKQGRHPVEALVRKSPVSLKLGFSGDGYGYAIDLGLPQPDHSASPSQFTHDPVIKVESLWAGETLGRANAFAIRAGPSVRIRDGAGAWRSALHNLASFDSMMTHCNDTGEALDLWLLRERMRDWRFYDLPRTDGDAPGASAAGRHLHPCPGERRSGPRRRLANHSRDRRRGRTQPFDHGRLPWPLQPLDRQYRRLFRDRNAPARDFAPIEGRLSFPTARCEHPLLDRRALVSASPGFDSPERTRGEPASRPGGAVGRLIEQAAKRSQIVVVSHAPGVVRN